MEQNYELATLGAGCFWCVEAIFQRLQGVLSVVSGYSGGNIENPDYKSVCTGQTGHAEVIQIKFNPQIISFEDVLYMFWRTHDPTTLNRQGADEGTQYRSVIFYHNEKQKEIAEKSKMETDKLKIYNDPIITEITKFSKFYPAEDYHQNYFNDNQFQPYCSFVISPKVKKLEKEFSERLKLK